MRTEISLAVGLEEWSVNVDTDRLMELNRMACSKPTGPPGELVREALEHPYGFEPLRRALTPDDRVTLVLDERLPYAAEMVSAILDHLLTARIDLENVTILTPPRRKSPGVPSPEPFFLDRWLNDLPDAFADVRTEIHDPGNRSRLAYLATTQNGRRLYLNRSLVEADFVIVLTGRGYDPCTGYSGAEAALFPTFADSEALAAYALPVSYEAPDNTPWPLRAEAREITWLLGTPFFVQVISGPGDSIAEVVAGLPESCSEGIRRLDARWRSHITRRADTVVALIAGDPMQVEFAQLARAVSCAARVVKPNGRIVLLTAAAPVLPDAVDRMRQLSDPASAAKAFARMRAYQDGTAEALQWCHAAAHASVFLASEYPEEFTEELFATPLHSPREIQRLLDAGGDILIIPDADKSMISVLPCKG